MNDSSQFGSRKYVGHGNSPARWWTLLVALCILCASLIVVNDSITMVAGIGITLLLIVIVVYILKYPFLGLLFYLGVFLLRPGELFPVLDHFRIELLIGALVIIAIVINQKLLVGKVAIVKDKITISLFVLLVVTLLSVFTSYEKTQTIEQTIAFFKIFIFYYLIVSLVTSKKRFIVFCFTFCALITYIGFDALVSYFRGEFVHTMNVDRLTGTTSSGGDPNTLANTLAAAIPLLISTAAYFKNRFVKSILWIFSLLIGYLIVITASRGGMLACLGVIIGYIVFSKHKVLGVIVALVLVISVWQVMPDQYQARYERFFEISKDVNRASSGRWEIWKAGIRMTISHPILGVGAGAFSWAYASGDFGPPQRMESHNILIQVLATTGIVGLGAWLLFIGMLIKTLAGIGRGVRGISSCRWCLTYKHGLMIVLIALFVSGMFGHSLYRYTWYLVAGLAVSLENILEKTLEREKVPVEPYGNM